MTRIAAVVPLFNPKDDVFENLKSYLFQVEKIYVIDNSEVINHQLNNKLKKIPRLKYIKNQSNIGIAAALNIAAKLALEEGFNYLLTMDQDSSAPDNMIKILYELMSANNYVGITAAKQFDPSIHPPDETLYIKSVLFTMASGNLINLEVFRRVGYFLEDLFIDHVDHEFCLRLNKYGFKVIITNHTFVRHKLGLIKKKKIFNRNYFPINHTPLRLYYRFRNRFYVNKMYKEDFWEYVQLDRKNSIRELLTILLFEKDRIKKIKMILLGYMHFKRNILGKFNT